jgi:hypothetical protein
MHVKFFVYGTVCSLLIRSLYVCCLRVALFNSVSELAFVLANLNRKYAYDRRRRKNTRPLNLHKEIAYAVRIFRSPKTLHQRKSGLWNVPKYL